MFNGILTENHLKFDRDGKARTAYSLRHSYICFRLLEGADIYQIAKNCRTSVEMIEKHYAAHLKDMIDTSLINVRKSKQAPKVLGVRKMNRGEANQIVSEAIENLMKNDRELLELGVTERALSHKLAEYITLSNKIVPPLVVDCEYNRHLTDIKRLNLPTRKALDNELRATTVFPDIIVHERNSDDSNLIVLELKKPDEDIAYDRRKLEAFVSEFGYRHAAHVILGMDRRGDIISIIEWID